MGGTFSIARFAPSSLTTPRFRWLHEEAWEESHKRLFFAEVQARWPLGILCPPPFRRDRRRQVTDASARYVLEMPAGTPVAALELRVERRVFSTVSLLVSRCHMPGGWTGEAREALAFGVSASLILGSADVAALLPCSAEVEAELASLSWGRSHRAWTPLSEDAWLIALRRGAGQARGVQVALIDIDPPDWWQTPEGIEARKSLSYLEKRVAFENRPAPAARAPRGGILSRFLRWS